MKTLLLDIETAPNRVYTWGLFKQNVSLSQIDEPGYTMCWAAKWLGKKKVMFSSVYEDGVDYMLGYIYELLEEADAVVHYNGSNFDIPTLNREFVACGWPPPAPFAEIDMLKTCRSRFRFLSNKLDYVAEQLTGRGKVQHKGMELWRGCMANDPASWKVMKRYNKRDVVILEDVYNELLPWIQPHPNVALYTDGTTMQCPNCGSEKLQSRGQAPTLTMRYQRFQCQDCGKWTRERTNNLSAKKRKSIIVGVK